MHFPFLINVDANFSNMHNSTQMYKALESRIRSIASPPETSALLRLTPIRPPALCLLILTHARTQSEIYPRRNRKPKALSNLDEIQLMHIEDGSQTMACIGLEIATIPVLGGFVQVVVWLMSFSSCDCTLTIFLAGNSNSTTGTRAVLRCARKPTSEG